MSNAAWYAVAFCTAILVIVLFCLQRRRGKWISRITGVPRIEKDIIDLQEVVEFFKQSAIAEMLKTKPDLMAIVIKERLKAGGFLVAACLFDKNTKSVDGTYAKIYQVKEIGPSLVSVFADKDMIVIT